jgi:sugar lactone lactonase YvrE
VGAMQALFFCDHGHRRIGRVEVSRHPHRGGQLVADSRSISTVVDSAVIDRPSGGQLKKRRLNSPNDLARAPDGSIWCAS